MNNIILFFCSLLFSSQLFANYQKEVLSIEKHIYFLSEKITNKLQFKIKPMNIDKIIKKSLHLKKSLNIYFLCTLDNKNNFNAQLIGLNNFKNMKKGLIKSLKQRYYNLNPFKLNKRFRNFTFKQENVSNNSKFNYVSKYNNKYPAIVKLKLDKAMQKVSILQNHSKQVFAYSFEKIKNKLIYRLSSVSQKHYNNKHLYMSENAKISYVKFRTLSVINTVNIESTINNKKSKYIIKFYDYKYIN